MFCVWPEQVVSYVLQGRLEEARQMLVKQATLQPAARNMYKLMDTLLSKMPFYNVRNSFFGSGNTKKEPSTRCFLQFLLVENRKKGIKTHFVSPLDLL